MHLTRSTNLGLQIVLELTRQQTNKEGSQRLTAATISEALEASPTHVAKLTSRLVDIGVINSARGRTGGISIAPGGLSIGLGDLIRELEGDSDSVDRFIDQSICARISTGPCILTQSLNAAEEKFYTSLNELTVADALPTTITPEPYMIGQPADAEFPAFFFSPTPPRQLFFPTKELPRLFPFPARPPGATSTPGGTPALPSNASGSPHSEDSPGGYDVPLESLSLPDERSGSRTAE